MQPFFVLSTHLLTNTKNYKEIDEYAAYEFGEKADFLYGNVQNDLSDYFLEIISKQKRSQDTYMEIESKMEYGYLPISESDATEKSTQICVKRIKDEEEEKCLRVNDIIRIKRFYLKSVEEYKMFEDRVRDCFPNVVFHNDAFKYITKLGKCADVMEELVRHLTILNDVGRRLFYYHDKNEKDTIDELKSGYGIVCSGKGSKEEKSYNKDMIYNGRKFQLTCNPHTKLYREGTDQRIYFCWGRDEIESHSIIIVRIGDHWKE
jgi:hypothetical protein